MKFFIYFFLLLFIYIYKGPLFFATEKGNIEIMKLLLQNEKVNINAVLILILKYFIKL